MCYLMNRSLLRDTIQRMSNYNKPLYIYLHVYILNKVVIISIVKMYLSQCI